MYGSNVQVNTRPNLDSLTQSVNNKEAPHLFPHDLDGSTSFWSNAILKITLVAGVTLRQCTMSSFVCDLLFL